MNIKWHLRFVEGNRAPPPNSTLVLNEKVNQTSLQLRRNDCLFYCEVVLIPNAFQGTEQMIYFGYLSFTTFFNSRCRLSTTQGHQVRIENKFPWKTYPICESLLFGCLHSSCLHFQSFHRLTGGKLNLVFRSKKITPIKSLFSRLAARIAQFLLTLVSGKKSGILIACLFR